MSKEPSLSYYLPIAGGRMIGFIPFPRVLVLCEMQSVSSKIWTRIAVSIPNDDNLQMFSSIAIYHKHPSFVYTLLIKLFLFSNSSI